MKYKDNKVEFSSNIEDLENFNAQNAAAICFIVADGKILLVKKNPARFKNDSYWGLPGGKLEANESPEQAVVREVLEETALDIANREVQFTTKLHVRIPHMDYVLYVFKTQLKEKPETLAVKIDNVEHCDFNWSTPEQALDFNLMFGGNELIKSIFK